MGLLAGQSAVSADQRRLSWRKSCSWNEHGPWSMARFERGDHKPQTKSLGGALTILILPFRCTVHCPCGEVAQRGTRRRCKYVVVCWSVGCHVKGLFQNKTRNSRRKRRSKIASRRAGQPAAARRPSALHCLNAEAMDAVCRCGLLLPSGTGTTSLASAYRSVCGDTALAHHEHMHFLDSKGNASRAPCFLMPVRHPIERLLSGEAYERTYAHMYGRPRLTAAPFCGAEALGRKLSSSAARRFVARSRDKRSAGDAGFNFLLAYARYTRPPPGVSVVVTRATSGWSQILPRYLDATPSDSVRIVLTLCTKALASDWHNLTGRTDLEHLFRRRQANRSVAAQRHFVDRKCPPEAEGEVRDDCRRTRRPRGTRPLLRTRASITSCATTTREQKARPSAGGRGADTHTSGGQRQIQIPRQYHDKKIMKKICCPGPRILKNSIYLYIMYNTNT
jgi:hypothetical protein